MVEANKGLIPIKVKAGATGNLKSMHLLLNRQPEIPKGIKVSLDNFETCGKIRSIPLYAFGPGWKITAGLSRVNQPTSLTMYYARISRL